MQQNYCYHCYNIYYVEKHTTLFVLYGKLKIYTVWINDHIFMTYTNQHCYTGHWYVAGMSSLKYLLNVNLNDLIFSIKTSFSNC